MEFSILYSIPRTELLDRFFLLITGITGDYGQLWLVLGLILIIFKKTRQTGVAVVVSYLAVFVFGQLLLKNLIDRPRPCQIDQAFQLLVTRPTSSSFPSSHSGFAFGAATAVFMKYKKAGFILLILAALSAYSRMYLFLHFPTDVLTGVALGIFFGITAAKLCRIKTGQGSEDAGVS